MADAMQKDEMCKGCYSEERSYTVGPCNECSRAFSGMQRDWYLTSYHKLEQPVSDLRIENKQFPSDLGELDKKLSVAAAGGWRQDASQHLLDGAAVIINDDLSGLQGIKIKVTSDDEGKYLTKLVDDHWAYIEGLLKAHDTDGDIIEVAKFHYKSAFRHGFKHALEYVKERYYD